VRVHYICSLSRARAAAVPPWAHTYRREAVDCVVCRSMCIARLDHMPCHQLCHAISYCHTSALYKVGAPARRACAYVTCFSSRPACAARPGVAHTHSVVQMVSSFRFFFTVYYCLLFTTVVTVTFRFVFTRGVRL